MNARLLSFLNQVQDAISRKSGAPVEGTRMVSFHKGIARLTFKDGAVQVQAFELADGQNCVKTVLFWSGIEEGSVHSVYPTSQDFDWARSASRIAQVWIDGPIAAGVGFGLQSSPALSKLASVG